MIVGDIVKKYFLNIESPITGGYFSSEQIDLLSIIQCHSISELIGFVTGCDQINHLSGIIKSINNLDLEFAKRYVFKLYQDTMVYHDQGLDESRANRLKYLGITPDELNSVINNTHPKSKEIISLNHHFISEEWSQTKSVSYEEVELLGSLLPELNSITISSGSISKVVNKYAIDDKYDFYFAKRDLDFAYKKGKHVRYHSLLVKDDSSHLFEGMTKDNILDLIRNYVKASIDFINDYNSNHKVNLNGEEPIINAIDLFNEIISFEKNENGDYYNIWNQKYGITMSELLSCFKYAKEHKPENVSYLYNEPFLEDDQRRKKVFETLYEIEKLSPGLIDSLGSQMHISITENTNSIRRCYEEFKILQERGINIQITEFDMSLGKDDIQRVFGSNATIPLNLVYEEKEKKISEISSIITESGVNLSGISYWSLSDGIDHNLERIRSDALAKHQINNINEIPTACGGLLPTYIQNE